MGLIKLKVEGVLFDLGNTLVGGTDTPEAFETSVAAVALRLREMGVEVDVRKLAEARLRNRLFFNKLRKATLREVLGEVWMRKDLEDAGLSPDDRIVKEAIEAHCNALIKLRRLFPEVPEVLEKLKDSGYVMAIVSNVSIHRMAEESLSKLNLTKFFKALVTSASVGWRKPHPTIFSEALRTVDLLASRVFFVGDSLWEDVYGAKSVGIKAILINRGIKLTMSQPPSANPEAQISSLTQLFDLLSPLKGEL